MEGVGSINILYYGGCGSEFLNNNKNDNISIFKHVHAYVSCVYAVFSEKEA
jgi:hypothetical protein